MDPFSRSGWNRLAVFLREARSELARVIWPTRREIVVYSIVVLAVVLVLGAFVSALDLFFFRLVVELLGS